MPPPPPHRSDRVGPRGTATTQRQRSGIGKRASSGASSSDPGLPAALHDEPAEGECPGTDGRASTPADGPGQLRRFRRQAVQLGQRPGDRQPELGPGAQPAVRRESPDARGGERPRSGRGWARNRSGKLHRPLGVRALGRDAAARARPRAGATAEGSPPRGRRTSRPRRPRRSSTPKCSRAGGLDEDATAIGHTR